MYCTDVFMKTEDCEGESYLGNHGNCAALLLVLVHVVVQLVEVLCYKQEGHGFDLGWCHWNFSLT